MEHREWIDNRQGGGEAEKIKVILVFSVRFTCTFKQWQPLSKDVLDSLRPLIYILFLVGGDNAIACRVSDAEEDESLSNLIIIKKSLVTLINSARNQTASAGNTGPRTTRIGQVEATVLSCI